MIYKYPITPKETQLELPVGARPLCCQVQYGEPQVWALVDPDQGETEMWRLRVVGTGWKDPSVDGWDYLSTFQLERGMLVFHVFTKGPQ